MIVSEHYEPVIEFGMSFPRVATGYSITAFPGD